MKVQVTFDVNHDDRLVIGMAEAGEFNPATREQVRDFVLRTHEDIMSPARKQLDKFYKALLKDIQDGVKED